MTEPGREEVARIAAGLYPTVRKIVGPTILLASGNYFDLLAPETSTFTIEDIAYGRAHVGSFAGQCSRF